MISPPGRVGVAFSDKSDGDLRQDTSARHRASQTLGISQNWAYVRQVHGNDVVRVGSDGDHGHADALWTTEAGLPLAIFTADCFGVVMHADDAVGVAHAGWRGAREGVVERLRVDMSEAGHPPRAAEVGPGIGSCCFEVGAEVAAEFEGYVTRTSWDTTSVDLESVLGAPE